MALRFAANPGVPLVLRNSPIDQAQLLPGSRLANVAGTQEPIYGPSAIKSVAQEAQATPHTEIARDDLKWRAMDSTCVETESFYLLSNKGDIALAQVIYSNVAYVPHQYQLSPSLRAFRPDTDVTNLMQQRHPNDEPIQLQGLLQRPGQTPSLVLHAPEQRRFQ